MITATVTLNVALFIFFLLLAFFIGLLVAFWAASSAISASDKETRDRNGLRWWAGNKN